MFGIAGTTLAFPVDFSGDASLQFRSYDDSIDAYGAFLSSPPTSVINQEQARLRLNFTGQVDQDVTLYGRLAFRSVWGTQTSDWSNNPIDQYGVKIADNGWTYNLGRQAVSLGQGAIISTGNDVAIDNKFDGLAASGKLGAVDTKVIIGKTTGNASDNSDNGNSFSATWMGIDFSVPVNDALTFGVTYASAKIGDPTASNGASKYLGFNATFSPSANLTFNSEYVKANNGPSEWANGMFDSGLRDDTAYFIAGTYCWDNDSFAIQYNKVGVSSVDPFNSGIGAAVYPYNLAYSYGSESDWSGDSKYSGFTYTYTHQMSKAASLSICYMDLKNDVSTGNDREYAAGIDWKF